MSSNFQPLRCYGCNRPVGERGTPPAEVIRLSAAELRIHRSYDCRTLALRRYLAEAHA